jgi:hypothetical protein
MPAIWRDDVTYLSENVNKRQVLQRYWDSKCVVFSLCPEFAPNKKALSVYFCHIIKTTETNILSLPSPNYMLQGHGSTSSAYRAALSHQYSTASFATLWVLSCLHSPELRLSCCKVARFCCDIEFGDGYNDSDTDWASKTKCSASVIYFILLYHCSWTKRHRNDN